MQLGQRSLCRSRHTFAYYTGLHLREDPHSPASLPSLVHSLSLRATSQVAFTLSRYRRTERYSPACSVQCSSDISSISTHMYYLVGLITKAGPPPLFTLPTTPIGKLSRRPNSRLSPRTCEQNIIEAFLQRKTASELHRPA